jgi:hypothetical protein
MECLKLLSKEKLPYQVGGTVAVNFYTGLNRPTKDLDIFCKPSDFPKIMQAFTQNGFKSHVEDERWLSKVIKGKYYLDIVFNSPSGHGPVTDEWFKESVEGKILGQQVKILSPTELIYSKAFIQGRYKYDGADVAHLILLKNKQIDWKRLLRYLDQYWEILLVHLLNFRFIYPSEREEVPRWLLDELLSRLTSQINLPTSLIKVCRGRLLSREDYELDIKILDFADIVGGKDEPKK